VIRTLGRVTVGFTLVLAASGVAAADEAKTPVSAAMILNIMSAPVPVDSRKSAFDESLKRPAPPTQDASEGEVLPDGSVRYGRTVITVKNPCPPGTSHWEPPPLPGRRSRLAR
jgi:hypothetical protein